MQAEAVKGDLVRRCHVATGPLLPFGSSVFKQLGHPSVCSSCLQEERAPERIFQKLHTLKNNLKKPPKKPTTTKKKPQSPTPNKPPHPKRQIKDHPDARKQSPSLPGAGDIGCRSTCKPMAQHKATIITAQTEPGQPPPASSPARPACPPAHGAGK